MKRKRMRDCCKVNLMREVKEAGIRVISESLILAEEIEVFSGLDAEGQKKCLPTLQRRIEDYRKRAASFDIYVTQEFTVENISGDCKHEVT